MTQKAIPVSMEAHARLKTIANRYRMTMKAVLEESLKLFEERKAEEDEILAAHYSATQPTDPLP